MNIYRCISEELTARIPILDDGTGPYEPYGIAELVAAETPGKAKWMAWRTDGSFDGDVRNMPKFSVVKTRKDVSLPEGVIDRPKLAWWNTASETRAFWRGRHAEGNE